MTDISTKIHWLLQSYDDMQNYSYVCQLKRLIKSSSSYIVLNDCQQLISQVLEQMFCMAAHTKPPLLKAFIWHSRRYHWKSNWLCKDVHSRKAYKKSKSIHHILFSMEL